MLVLIAPETDLVNEIDILHKLFEHGLKYFHLRKPDKNYQEHAEYLNKIDSQYYPNIVTHYHHELLTEFGLKGIHFQEQKRRDELEENHTNIPSYLKALGINKENLSVSSSFHEPQEISDCLISFNYHLLSPVFSSISKPGYDGKGFHVKGINKRIIGMGGVSIHNVDEILNMGYKGIGVLGGIWKSDMPIEDFIQMNHSFVSTPYMTDDQE